MEGKAREKPAGREALPHMLPLFVSKPPINEGGFTLSGEISQRSHGIWQGRWSATAGRRDPNEGGWSCNHPRF